MDSFIDNAVSPIEAREHSLSCLGDPYSQENEDAWSVRPSCHTQDCWIPERWWGSPVQLETMTVKPYGTCAALLWEYAKDVVVTVVAISVLDALLLVAFLNDT